METNIIHSSLILSAFQNAIDEDSLEYYMNKPIEEWKPINGFESVIDEDDVEDEKFFISGEPVTKEHIGCKVLYVTDGHHRSIVASRLGLNIHYLIDPATKV